MRIIFEKGDTMNVLAKFCDRLLEVDEGTFTIIENEVGGFVAFIKQDDTNGLDNK